MKKELTPEILFGIIGVVVIAVVVIGWFVFRSPSTPPLPPGGVPHTGGIPLNPDAKTMQFGTAPVKGGGLIGPPGTGKTTKP